MATVLPLIVQPRAHRRTRVEFSPCAGYAFLESLFAAQRRLTPRLPAGWEDLAPAALREAMGPDYGAWLETLFGGPAWGMAAASLVDPAAGTGAGAGLRRALARTPPEDLWRYAAATLGEAAGPPGDAATLSRMLLDLLAWHAPRFDRLAGAVQETLDTLAAAERREWETDPPAWLEGRIGDQQAAVPGGVVLRVHPSPFLGSLAVLLFPAAPGEPALLLYGAEAAAPDRCGRLDELVAYHRALADPSRMHIVAMLHREPRTAAGLGRELDLSPPTISHHLARLRALGLVSGTAEGGGPVLWRLEIERLREYGRLAGGGPPPPRPPREDGRARALAAYFRGGRLVAIPRHASRRGYVLREIRRCFEAGVDYPEAEVNTRLGRFHDDYARLRRELVEAGYLTRAGGIYRVAGEEEDR